MSPARRSWTWPRGRRRLPGRARALLAALLAALAASSCAIVDYEQRRWIFQPVTHTWVRAEAALPGMEEVWIDYRATEPPHGDDGQVRLHGLWLPHPEPQAPVLLFLHGVRWDVRASAPRMRQLHALGFSVLAIDYRGFGRSSEALPSESLIAEDSRAAWAWLAERHPTTRRFIYGHSLGATVAVRLAAESGDESGLIVDGGFTSTTDVLRSTRWGWLPITWMITQHFDAGSRIATVGSPVLVVHGRDDTMIAPALGRELYRRAAEPKRFVLVEGAVHENTTEVGQAVLGPVVRELFGVGFER